MRNLRNEKGCVNFLGNFRDFSQLNLESFNLWLWFNTWHECCAHSGWTELLEPPPAGRETAEILRTTGWAYGFGHSGHSGHLWQQMEKIDAYHAPCMASCLHNEKKRREEEEECNQGKLVCRTRKRRRQEEYTLSRRLKSKKKREGKKAHYEKDGREEKTRTSKIWRNK